MVSAAVIRREGEKPGVVVDVCNPHTRKAEVGRSRVPGQSRSLIVNPVSKNNPPHTAEVFL